MINVTLEVKLSSTQKPLSLSETTDSFSIIIIIDHRPLTASKVEPHTRRNSTTQGFLSLALKECLDGLQLRPRFCLPLHLPAGPLLCAATTNWWASSQFMTDVASGFESKRGTTKLVCSATGGADVVGRAYSLATTTISSNLLSEPTVTPRYAVKRWSSIEAEPCPFDPH